MQKIKKNCWSTEEITLLSQLHPQFPSKRWKRIAEQFRARGYDRSEIQCREKWINFLDPEINRKGWEDWELKKLYEVHEQVGTRWCLVQKAIGRTQNKIKNHFYGTLRNLIRFVLAFFDAGKTCYNSEISHLPPCFLNALYNSTQQFAFMGSEVKDAIYGMGFKVDKHLLTQRIEGQRELYMKLDQVLKQEFAAKSTHSSEDQAASQESREAVPQMECLGFNNQADSTSGLAVTPNPFQMPFTTFQSLPFPTFQYPGLFYWYS